MTEKMNARIGILPLLQAEHDRKYVFLLVYPVKLVRLTKMLLDSTPLEIPATGDLNLEIVSFAVLASPVLLFYFVYRTQMK